MGPIPAVLIHLVRLGARDSFFFPHEDLPVFLMCRQGGEPQGGKTSVRPDEDAGSSKGQGTGLSEARVLRQAAWPALHRHYLLGSSDHQEHRRWSYPRDTKAVRLVSGHTAQGNRVRTLPECDCRGQALPHASSLSLRSRPVY